MPSADSLRFAQGTSTGSAIRGRAPRQARRPGAGHLDRPGDPMGWLGRAGSLSLSKAIETPGCLRTTMALSCHGHQPAIDGRSGPVLYGDYAPHKSRNAHTSCCCHRSQSRDPGTTSAFRRTLRMVERLLLQRLARAADRLLLRSDRQELVLRVWVYHDGLLGGSGTIRKPYEGRAR